MILNIVTSGNDKNINNHHTNTSFNNYRSNDNIRYNSRKRLKKTIVRLINTGYVNPWKFQSLNQCFSALCFNL